jgi:hypothetical protein
VAILLPREEGLKDSAFFNHRLHRFHRFFEVGFL